MDLPEGAPLTGDEYAQLRNLYSAYNLSSDNGPASTFAECFTPKGVLNLMFAGHMVTGATELEHYKQEDLRSRQASGEVRRHVNESIYATRDASGEIRVVCYYYLLVGSSSAEGPPPRLDAGTYSDIVSQEEGGQFRFARRDVTRNLTVPLTA